MRKIHMIAVDESAEGSCISGTSPQLPGFLFGRADKKAFERDLKAELRQFLGDDQVLQVVGHTQWYGLDSDGREFAVRWAETDRADRIALAQRLIGSIQMGHTPVEGQTQGRELLPVFVCALPGDTLASLVEQLDGDTDALLFAVPATDELIFVSSIAGSDHGSGWPTLDEHGWTPETTVGDVMRQMAGRPSAARVAVAV